MKQTVLNLIFICLVGSGFAADKNNTVAESTQALADTQQINFLLRECRALNLIDYRKAIKSGNEALKLSVHNNYSRGKANSLYEIGNVYFEQNAYDTALYYYNEALRTFSSVNDKKGIGFCYKKIGTINSKRGNYKEGLFYFYEALEIFSSLNEKQGLYEVLNYIGTIYGAQGNYNKALDYQLQALDISKELKNLRGVSSVLGNIGLIYFEIGDTKKAYDYYDNSLKIALTIDYPKQVANMYNNIGLLKQIEKQYDKAIEFDLKAVKLFYSLKDQLSVYNTLRNIGQIHELKAEYDMASNYYMRCINIATEINYNVGVSESFLQIGLMFNKRGMDQKAIYYYNKALNYANLKHESVLVAKSYLYFGNLYSLSSNFPMAKDYFAKSYKLARQLSDKPLIRDYFKSMSENYALMNDYKNAFQFSQYYAEIKDTINREESARRFSQLQIGFDFDNQETQIALLKRNNEVKNLEIEKQQFLKYILILVISIVVISIFLVYSRYRFARKSNIILQEQKEEISRTNEKLMLSEKNLKEMNATKDKLFSIISHDLRNPFAAIISFSRIMKRDINQYKKEEIQLLTDELDKSVNVISNLLENVLQWSRHQTGRIKYAPDYFSIGELVDDVLSALNQNIKEKDLIVKNSINLSLEVWADSQLTEAILKNLLSNAIKFSHDGSLIEIDSVIENDSVNIMVTDNGVGIEAENLKNIFNVELHKVTYGTNDEKGSGLGLILCKSLTEIQGGSLKILSEVGKGTTVTFSIPLSEIEE